MHRHPLLRVSSLIAIAHLLCASAGCVQHHGGGGTGGAASTASSGAGGGSVGAGGAGGASSVTSAASSVASGASSGAGGGSHGGGDLLWTKVFPTELMPNYFVNVGAIAADPSGNVVIGGQLSGNIHFSGDVLSSLGHENGFVVWLDGAGSYLVADQFGSTVDNVVPSELVVDAASNVLAAGTANANLQEDHALLYRYGAPGKPGQASWNTKYSGPTWPVYAEDLTTDAAGDAVVITFIPPVAPPGVSTGYRMEKRDPTGALLWSQTPPSGIIAADGPGNIFALSGQGQPGLTKLDPTGSVIWVKNLSIAGITILLVDPAGAPLLAGAVSGTVDFGGGPLTSVGTKDVVIAKLDPQGNHLWSKRLGQAGTDIAGLRGAVDGAGNLILCGVSTGPLDLGGGPLPSGGFIAKFSSSGDFSWSRSIDPSPPLGGPDAVIAGGVDGSVFLASSSPTLDLGTGPLLASYKTPTSTQAFLVAKLAP